MDKYCIYYIPKTSDPESDLLMIYFGGNKQVTNRVEQNGVKVLLSGDSVIGFVLSNFSKLCKVKVRGMIYMPSQSLIDVINGVLDNASLPTLECLSESGYVTGKVIDKKQIKDSYIYSLDIGGENVYSQSYADLVIGEVVVLARNGTYLLPGKMITSYKIENNDDYISGGRICSLRDLQIFDYDNIDDVALLGTDAPVGLDFFFTEEKYDA